MGKNAAHKQQQRARHGGPDEAGPADAGDGTVDASFHSPAWYANCTSSHGQESNDNELLSVRKTPQ